MPAASRFTPLRMPAEIVVPERDSPGRIANICETPMIRVSRSVIFSSGVGGSSFSAAGRTIRPGFSDIRSSVAVIKKQMPISSGSPNIASSSPESFRPTPASPAGIVPMITISSRWNRSRFRKPSSSLK